MKWVVLLVLLLALTACSTGNAEESTEDTLEELMEKAEETTEASSESGTQASITVTTSKGAFTFTLYEDTPISTANFISLAEAGFYDGLTFHRYEPGFVIQGGDPSGDGTGGSDATIELEIAEGRSHSTGTLGMARSSDPNSASSQWFVNLADNTFLDGDYAVFGEVTDGMDVVEQLRAGDVMDSVTVSYA
jgi:peptidyl-prolyl cis-trans isomerase B (cyclophilin B)